MEKFVEKLRDKLLLISKHYILLWLLVFPPVAIYKCFKHKIFSKKINIIITIILISLTLLTSMVIIVDYFNPTGVLDTKVQEELEEKDIGNIREITYLGMIDDKIGAYEIITTKGFYNIYISSSDNKTIQFEGIKDVINDETLDSSKSFSEIYQKLNPETLAFFIEKPEYNKDIKEIEHRDNYDMITYKDGTILRFVNEYYIVSKVYEIQNGEELIYNRDVLIEFRKDFRRVLNKNDNIFKDIKEVNAYVVNENEIYYIFTNFCDNQYKIIKYNNGYYDLLQPDNNVSKEEVDKLWKEYKKKN